VPEKYHRNNVFGGECLLKAMAESGCKKIVFSSSAAVYGEPNEIPISEKHVLKPISVYGETKALFEEMLKNYDKDSGIKSLCLRYFNAGGASENGEFGEMHEPESHLIPNVLKAAKKSGEFKLFGDDYETKDGTCVRDYIHVTDLAKAHLLAAKYLLNGGESEVVNLGTGEGFSVKEIVNVCKKVTEKKFEVLIEDRRVGDPAVLVASNEKAGKLLFWKPEKSIKEIVESAWRYEENHCND
jgi:UDP-glucose 4-epimerase